MTTTLVETERLVVAPAKDSDIYDAVADIMEQRWCTNSLRNRYGNVCVLGGFHEVLYGEPYDEADFYGGMEALDQMTANANAYTRLRHTDILKQFAQTIDYTDTEVDVGNEFVIKLFRWNDHSQQQDVVAALRAAASASRQQGN